MKSNKNYNNNQQYLPVVSIITCSKYYFGAGIAEINPTLSSPRNLNSNGKKRTKNFIPPF